MKKIFSLIALVLMASFSFATSEVETEKEKASTETVKKVEAKQLESSVTQNSSHQEDFCTVSCSATTNGVTTTFTAGNFLSSCEGAERRCRRKLSRAGFGESMHEVN